jgi:antirestriction protein ArdC
MTTSSSSSSRFDVYEAITNQIINAIETGSGKVQMPWHRSGASIMRPVNVASRNAYRGVNTVALWAAADAFGFPHGL